MNRSYILGGVLAAAVLAGGGAALGVAMSAPDTPAAAAESAAAGPSIATAPGSGTPASGLLGTAALEPGNALVDGGGRALYLFEADTGTASTCSGPCAQVWPPLLTTGAAPATADGVQAGLVASSPRADGTTQVTYNGHPLYYFAGDKGPGDVRGQGIDNFGGGWYVVTPTGDKIDSDDPIPAKPAPAPAPLSGYGY
jgi:predicted lipoprotein with Yx(FWY)xxD motif